MVEPIWLTRARSYIGQREIAGAKHNALILRWWTAIRAPFTDDETPWCAGFVGGVFEECGLRSSRSAAARSYLNWGQKLLGPAVGAVGVFERGPTHGHVAFILGWDGDGNLVVLGGNQANMVSIMRIAYSRLIASHWPNELPLPELQGLRMLPVLGVGRPISRAEQ